MSAAPVSIATLMALDDQILLEELRVAYMILRNKQLAMEAVAQAAAMLPYTSAEQIRNRLRNAATSKGRASYRSFAGRRELLRFLVLAKTGPLERAQEAAGNLLTPGAQLLCCMRVLVKSVLQLNSFYAAVVMGMLLCGYSDEETMAMYDQVILARSKRKDRTACARAMDTVGHRLMDRFAERLQWAEDESTVQTRRATPAETESVIRHLSLLMPPQSESPKPTPGNGFLARVLPILEESFAEVKHTYRFFEIPRFNELTGVISNGRPGGTFEARLRIPDIAVPTTTGPDSDGGCNDGPAPEFDTDRLKVMIEDYRDRRKHTAPGTLRIRVDDIDRGALDAKSSGFGALLEQGAGMVEVVGHTYSGEPVSLGAYILTYDSPKAECWNLDIDGVGQVCMDFDYRDDDCVSAVFSVCSDRVESTFPLAIRADSPETDPRDSGLRLADADHQQLVIRGEYGFGKTRAVLNWIADLLDPRMEHRSFKDLFENALDYLDYYRLVLRDLLGQRSCEVDIKGTAMVWARVHYSVVRKQSLADDSREIDQLVARQAQVFDDFLNKWQLHELVPISIPSIYEPHQKLARGFGALAIASLASEGLGLYFLSDLLKTLGPSITALALTGSALAAFVSGRLARHFGWSLRLYRKYYQAEYSIALLRSGLERLFGPGPIEALSASEGADLAERRGVTDWRGLPLARTLAFLLRSPGIQNSSNTASWIVNSISEKQLVQVLRELGEERRARRIAKAVISARPFESAFHLAQALGSVLALSGAVTRVLGDSIQREPAAPSILTKHSDSPWEGTTRC